ncbi:MAG: hypothetical protein CVV50_04660 [Spirochaetae bacterium HGW-Spirochaetae-6]|nr:MAG: hypothetical protein CVV50_04660 [Spirochaetae bacterium HGW-Spirochaetae-6]
MFCEAKCIEVTLLEQLLYNPLPYLQDISGLSLLKFVLWYNFFNLRLKFYFCGLYYTQSIFAMISLGAKNLTCFIRQVKIESQKPQ